MNNVILLPPKAGNEHMRVLLRNIVAVSPASDPAVVSPIGEKFALGSTRGLMRKQNEDRVAVTRIQGTNNLAWMLFTLCDGMGGMIDGARAAEIAIATFISSALGSRLGATAENMRQSVLSANEAVFNEFHGAGGTTISAAAWDGIKLVTVNVGDSRIYCLEEGQKLHQLTRDDNIIAHLQAQGDIDTNEARRDLLQFVGIGGEIDPHVNTHDSEKINMVIATTDGAHDLPDPVLSRMAQNFQLTSDLVDHILKLSLWTGGLDNATVWCFQACPTVPMPVGVVELWTPANYWRIVRNEIVEIDHISAIKALPIVQPIKHPNYNSHASGIPHKNKEEQDSKPLGTENNKNDPQRIVKTRRSKKSKLTMAPESLPLTTKDSPKPRITDNHSIPGPVKVKIRSAKENESVSMSFEGTDTDTRKED